MGVRIYSERGLENSCLGRKHLKSKFLVFKITAKRIFQLLTKIGLVVNLRKILGLVYKPLILF